MNRFIVLDKKVGETPLAAIQKWRLQNPEFKDVPASYAGRLDPMASGKLLVLLGEECKRQAAYTGLDKEYEVEVLLGVESDTGDVLGLTVPAETAHEVREGEIAKALRDEIGAFERSYPVFSSKTVKGKPLFIYALEGTLAIEIPKHIERIYALDMLDMRTVTNAELEKTIFALLQLVPRTEEPSKQLGANFRIDAVRESWAALFKNLPANDFTILRLKVACASGSYMRTLAPRIGEALGTKALALSIKRTKIGKYLSLWQNRGFWLKQF